MSQKNAFYAQSGGPTAVINASALGVIEQAKKYTDKIGKVYAGKNGILGALNEELIDTSTIPAADLQRLMSQPASAFGSCRYKLKSMKESEADYRRLIEVFKAHNIGYFFYNGGGDSQDTAYKISKISDTLDYPLTCIGIPKTIDNDLAFTDHCPGFGSVAKYIAISILEASFDLASMAASSTKVFILEVMGRHTGWIAAAGGLAQSDKNPAPHIILFPEIAFQQEKFLDKVQQAVSEHGYCSIVVSEGIKDVSGKFLSEHGSLDAFGHHQLGGVAPRIENMIRENLNLKCHWAVSDYLQRSARHIASKTDLEQAYALGTAAIDTAVSPVNNVMMTIERCNTPHYSWQIGTAPLADVANVEKTIPREFITKDGFGITAACRQYLEPLIQGEAYPTYHNGLPEYAPLQYQLAKKKCDITESVS
jgi:ATP-dependent phosphofructokinase / diphosphate-dependent phosphofructokinase